LSLSGPFVTVNALKLSLDLEEEREFVLTC